MGMRHQSFCLSLDTKKAPEFIDITDWVSQCVAQSKVSNGFAVVYSKHTTAAVKINENEPLLLQDMANFLEKFSPRDGCYSHNDFSIRTVNMTPDESPNGHAHLQHLLLGTSENSSCDRRLDAVRALPEHLFYRTGLPAGQGGHGAGSWRIAGRKAEPGCQSDKPRGTP